MRLGCCAILALSACYAPQIVSGAPCDPGVPNSCPVGQTCEPAGSAGVCSTGPLADAGGGGDAGVDAVIGGPPEFCLGANLLGRVCFPTMPTAVLRIAGTMTINTTSTNVGNCSEIRAQSGGPPLCIVAAETIEIASGGTLRGIGANPLVLFAARTISVAGTLDVASHFGETIGGVPVLGAGTRNAAECNAIGVDGKPSDGGNQGFNGGGGGAGGSFGSLGGAGGNGRGGVRGGVGVAGAAPVTLIGGCPGGHGGDGTDGGGGAEGGNGGGAAYLLAGDSVSIDGKINASGAGGSAGGPGDFSAGGGGGGGAGGMLVLEATRITATGSLFANGGGGGGAGTTEGNSGGPGGDPLLALTPALGGTSNDGGGPGGAGSTMTATGATGVNGANGSGERGGGGGGGGGAGVIRVFGDPAPVLPTISPPPS
jgi:hypothetical protein